MSCFPELKKLFSVIMFFAGWFSNNKSGDKETQSAKDIHAPVNFGNQSNVAGRDLYNINQYINQSEVVKKVNLTSLEEKILKMLAEGGVIVPFVCEDFEQYNMYGHSNQDFVNGRCCDEDIINCVKKFLKMGLIFERIQNGQTEYVISEKGRNNINC